MFNPNFNNSFQNMNFTSRVDQNQNMQGNPSFGPSPSFDPSQNAYYNESVNPEVPGMAMQNNYAQSNGTPNSGYQNMQSQQGQQGFQSGQDYSPYVQPFNTNTGSVYGSNPPGYAGGGGVEIEEEVIEEKPKKKNGIYPLIAEMIRQEGGEEDTILAHINPIEEQILAMISGGKDVNKKTGLPQFGFFNKPGKWLKSIAGPAAGSIIGNMILPGLGGIIGGGIGGAVGSKIRGRNDAGQAALRGAGIGALTPSIASLGGYGARLFGAENAGNYLSDYGDKNSILSALGRGFDSRGNGGSNIGSSPISGVSAGDDFGGSQGRNIISEPRGGGQGAPNFIDKFKNRTEDFLTNPSNLLTLASVGSQFLNRPKEKSPEKRASEDKRYQLGLQLSPAEMAQKEAHDLALEQSRRRIAQRKFIPEERIGPIEPLFRRVHTPEEREATGRWLSYYNNPGMQGAPVPYKQGGEVAQTYGMGAYIHGDMGGQDDDVNAKLSNGEYVHSADVVSALGDGNNAAGAKKLADLDRNVRLYRNQGNGGLPPKVKPIMDYMR